MDVSIIIISYNTRQLLDDCLDSVYKETVDCSFEVRVVDNHSTDGSAEFIRAHYPQVALYASEENLGFARANNMAAKDAQGELILLLNPDTVILDRAIDRLVAFARSHPEAKIWGGRTLFVDGTLNPTSCYGRMTLWSLFSRASGLALLFRSSCLFNPETFGNWRCDSPRSVDIVTGCLFLVSRSFWEKLGGFDVHFFMYGEEADLCLRASALGAHPLVTPEATILHYGGASEASNAVRMPKVFKAKVALMKKHWPRWKQYIGIRLLLLWALSRSFCSRLSMWRPGESTGSLDKWALLWRSRNEWTGGFDRNWNERR